MIVGRNSVIQGRPFGDLLPLHHSNANHFLSGTVIKLFNGHMAGIFIIARMQNKNGNKNDSTILHAALGKHREEHEVSTKCRP